MTCGSTPTPHPTVDRRKRSPGRRASDALPKVACPHCGGSVSIVTSSRPVLSRNGVRRRRECEDCGGRFTTIELLDTSACEASTEAHA